MPVELILLACAAAFGLLQIVVAAQLANRQRGMLWSAGPRDTPKPPLTGLAGRLERATGNFLETFPFFAAAVLAVHAADAFSLISELGAHLYFWARLVYLPLYAAGVFLLRSLVWNVAFVGIALVLFSLFGL